MPSYNQDTKAKSVRYNKSQFHSWLRRGNVVKVVDTIEDQLRELFLIRNPEKKYSKNITQALSEFSKKILGKQSKEKFGSWFLFSWNKHLVHFLPEKLHLEIRTARNRNIISKGEQRKFYDFNVGVAGLSIGSHAAATISMMGGARKIKLADPDTLSASNLNRVRYDFTQLGLKKVDLAYRAVKQVNPFAFIQTMGQLEENNIKAFFTKSFRIDILVEEVDNLALKFFLRFWAKSLRIPVVMATDNGDNVILDIERYDLNPKQEIFNGLVGEMTIKQFKKIPKDILPLFVGNIVGVDHVTPRVFESLSEVGKTLYSWPQLGSAANMSGSVLAYVVRQIAIGSEIPSGKYEVSIDKAFRSI